MAEILNPTNFDPINIVEKTKLNADAAASQAVIAVENTQGFVADDFVVVGRLGSEQAEILKVLSVASNQITFTTNLSFAHDTLEDVTKLRGDQIKVYRAANVDDTTPDDADFGTAITTLTIEADQMFTEYTDSTGGSDYWYKKTYYNSVALTETNLASALAVRGGDYGQYVTVSEVRAEAGFENNDNITDSEVADRRADAKSEVDGALSSRYTLPLTYVPEVVKNANKLIAAGYLLSGSYGIGVEGSAEEGAGKLKMGRKLLEGIRDGSIALIDQTGALISETQAGVGGYPDDDAPEEEDAKFKIDDEY